MDDRAEPRRRASRGIGQTAALVLIAMAPAVARGEPIRYQFTGMVTAADPSLGQGAGLPFSGTFTYDTRELGLSIGFEGTTLYNFSPLPGVPYPATSRISGIDVSVGGQPVFSSPGVLGMNLHESGLEYPSAPPGLVPLVTEVTVRAGGSPGQLGVSLDLTNQGRTVFPSFELPLTLNLSDFPSATFSVYVDRLGVGHEMLYQGEIDTLSPIPTPEPTAAALLALAALGRLTRARWRRAS